MPISGISPRPAVGYHSIRDFPGPETTMAAPTATGPGPAAALPGANRMLALLLVINLFNYVDRQVLSAVLPKLEVDASMFDPTDRHLGFKLGLLTSAFLVSYTVLSPVFGWFGDRGRRWFVVGVGVTVWSLASAGSGLATGFVMLLLTRCLVGVGEAAYGPVAPSMISDLYPATVRGKVMAYFYLAIPVGSALGFVLGGQIGEHLGWRAAFGVTVLGLVPALLCFVMPEPPRPKVPADAAPSPGYGAVVRELGTIRSFLLCSAGMTLTTFMLGGVAAWAPRYIFQREATFVVTPEVIDRLRTDKEFQTSTGAPLVPAEVVNKLEPLAARGVLVYPAFKAALLDAIGADALQQYGERVYTAATAPGSTTLGRVNLIFGVIVVVSGLGATILGGLTGDWLRDRGVRGAYFHAAGWTTVAAWPFFVAALFAPFPPAWGLLFVAVFFLFFNTGPANTVLANVTRSDIRATAFAVNILVIHLLGDVISPPIIGLIQDYHDLHTAFLAVSVTIPLGGLLWVLGARYLDADTKRVEAAGG
jgi:MFS family permease